MDARLLLTEPTHPLVYMSAPPDIPCVLNANEFGVVAPGGYSMRAVRCELSDVGHDPSFEPGRERAGRPQAAQRRPAPYGRKPECRVGCHEGSRRRPCPESPASTMPIERTTAVSSPQASGAAARHRSCLGASRLATCGRDRACERQIGDDIAAGTRRIVAFETTRTCGRPACRRDMRGLRRGRSSGCRCRGRQNRDTSVPRY